MGLSRRDSEQSMGEYHGGVLAAPYSGGQSLGMIKLFACYLDAFHEGKKTWLKLLRCIGIDVVSYHPEYLLASHDAENANMSLLNQIAWSSSFSVTVRSVGCICQAPYETSVLVKVKFSLDGCMEEEEVVCLRILNVLFICFVCVCGFLLCKE